MQNFVFVLDASKQPLSPCHPSVARKLLQKGKASVYKRFPFTVILKRAVEIPIVEPVTLKVDPGSKTTGIALVQGDTVIFAAELEHRGQQIKNALQSRKAIRRNRRSRKTRYRQAKFLNRTRPQGWLAGGLLGALKSRVDNLQTWFVRFYKLCNLARVSIELVRFDTQLMQNAEISGVEYQQGELQGYEVKEYLLEKYSRTCCYCGKQNVPFEVEHIISRNNGGSNRVSNLCLACHECNQRKGSMNADEFGFSQIQAQAKKPLKDASAVNSIRWAIWRMFDATGLPLEVGTGGRTKFNRITQAYPKAHWIDAACVGVSGGAIRLNSAQKPLLIRATGHGKRQMCRTDKFGFPVAHKERLRRRHGWRTGDLAKAIIPRGKYAGTYPLVRVVAKSGSFVFSAPGLTGKDHPSVNHKYLSRLFMCDGYSYSFV